MKQRPPVCRNVATLDEALGFPARHPASADGGRKRAGGIAADIRCGGLLEVGTDRASGQEQGAEGCNAHEQGWLAGQGHTRQSGTGWAMRVSPPAATPRQCAENTYDQKRSQISYPLSVAVAFLHKCGSARQDSKDTVKLRSAAQRIKSSGP